MLIRTRDPVLFGIGLHGTLAVFAWLSRLGCDVTIVVAPNSRSRAMARVAVALA